MSGSTDEHRELERTGAGGRHVVGAVVLLAALLVAGLLDYHNERQVGAARELREHALALVFQLQQRADDLNAAVGAWLVHGDAGARRRYDELSARPTDDSALPAAARPELDAVRHAAGLLTTLERDAMASADRNQSALLGPDYAAARSRFREALAAFDARARDLDREVEAAAARDTAVLRGVEIVIGLAFVLVLWRLVRMQTRQRREFAQTAALYRALYEKTETLMRSASDGIHVMTLDGVLVEAGDRFCAMLGYSREELVGHHVSFWDAHFAPDVIANIVTLHYGLQQHQCFDTKHRRKDGTVFDVEVTSFPLELDGKSLMFCASRDVSERKQYEARARDDAARLRLVLDSAAEGIYGVDRDHRCIFANRRCLDALGYAEESDILGLDMHAVAHHAHANGTPYPADCCPLRLAVTHGQEIHVVDEVFWRRDGTSFPVEYRARPYVVDGATIGAVCSFVDVGDRLAGERRLRLADVALNHTETAIYLADATGRLVEVNDAACRMLGYSRDELLARTVTDIDAVTSPDAWRSHVQNIRQHRAVRLDTAHRRRDGTTVSVEVMVTYFETGGVSYVLGLATDITQRKQIEAELESHRRNLEKMVEARTAELVRTNRRLYDTQFAMDSVGIGITWVTLGSGRFIYANRYAAELIGYTLEELLELRVSDIDPNFPLERFDEILESIRALGHLQFETQQRHKQGGTVPVEVTVYHHPGDEDFPARLIAFTADIRRRKEAEQALLLAKQAAEDASLAKSRFLSNMSHEIRTPLNGVLGMAQVLRRGGVSPAQAEQLDRIEASGRHLLGIINCILDLSKIEAGRFTLDESEFAIADLLRDVAAIAEGGIRAKGLEFAIDAGDAPPWVRGDHARLAQALVNYLGNATKFTAHGRIVLRCAVAEAGPQDWLLRFEVLDTGIGVEPEVLERLFTAFEQADSSTSRRFGGTGLGLALTRRLAEAMGGAAGAHSVPGGGSTFWFTARVGRCGALPAPASGIPAAHAEERIRALAAGLTVLVAEDEPTNLEITVLLLQHAGFATDTAEDGGAAVRLAGAHDYAFILMDMQMPIMDGLEATRRIRAMPAHATTPIVALTANAFDDDRARCFAAGMNDFIAKPIVPEQFFACLLGCLESGTVEARSE